MTILFVLAPIKIQKAVCHNGRTASLLAECELGHIRSYAPSLSALAPPNFSLSYTPKEGVPKHCVLTHPPSSKLQKQY